MADVCSHLDQIQDVVGDADGVCPDCVAIGGRWVHLRMCRSCGHVAGCDDSPNRHATAHYHATGHPVIRSTAAGRALELVLRRRGRVPPPGGVTADPVSRAGRGYRAGRHDGTEQQ